MRNQNKIFEKISIFTVYNELNKILQKVNQLENVNMRMDSIVSSQGVCRFTSELFSNYPQIEKLAGEGTGDKILSKVVEAGTIVFLPEKFSDSIQIIAKGKTERIIRFIHKNTFRKMHLSTHIKYLFQNQMEMVHLKFLAPPKFQNHKKRFRIRFLQLAHLAHKKKPKPV